MKGKLLFEETQTYRGTLVWYLTLVFCLGMVGLFAYAMFVQLVMGGTWGDKPLSDTGLILVFLLTLAICGGIFALIHIHKLVLSIDEGTVAYSFYPYISKTRVLYRDDIKSVAVRKYKPILEYGGWGYRIGSKDRAYTLWGKYGLQLEMANGKKLLIGTQKAPELEGIVRQLIQQGEEN